MLAGARFGNHALLAHANGEQCLAERVVDFVGAGVIEILALEIDLCAPEMLGPAACVVDGAWPAHVMLELVGELGEELGILLIAGVGGGQLIERLDQRFGHEDPAVPAEVAAAVGQVIHLHHAPPS